MKTTNLAKNITDLRRTKGITQEQLATALNLSPQAVSKWETATCLPDTQTLPSIADYFGVSIDYLFYGQDISYDEIYKKIIQKVADHPHMSKEAYEEVFTVFANAHRGMVKGLSGNPITGEPYHISNENGMSLLSGKGYGAILTREFFKSIDRDTAEFAATLLPALSDKNNLLVCMAIISLSGISFNELQEQLDLDEKALRDILDVLIASKIVIETESKHKSLGLTYEINSMYHTCLCLLIATIEMQKISLGGISCCMGYGDYPIDLK